MGLIVTRRNFLGTVAGGLTLTALNRRVLAQQKPNDQVVMGLIGVGGMGTNRLRDFIAHPDVRMLVRRPRHSVDNSCVQHRHLGVLEWRRMGDPGLEPGASALSERRSNRLS